MTAQSVLLLGLAIAIMALLSLLVVVVVRRIKKEKPTNHLTVQDMLKATALTTDDDETGQ